MGRNKIGASPWLDLRAVLGERSDHVSYGVGHDREVFAVARASTEDPYVTGPGGALLPKSTLAEATEDGHPMKGALAVGRGSDVFFFRDRRAYLLTEWWSGT